MYELNIAEKLTALRCAKGVTQDELAASLNVSNKTVSKWENGASSPDLGMLAEIAKYYNVTADSILGLAKEPDTDTESELRSMIGNLSTKEAILKTFSLPGCAIPTLYEALKNDNDSSLSDVFPENSSDNYRSCISTSEFFDFTASSDDINVAVMLLRNKENFSWMKENSQDIVKLFKFLSNEDALTLLHFISSDDCPKSFLTADFIAEKTALTTERTAELLDEFCEFGACDKMTAHLIEGETEVYEYYGDGLVLSIISLAYEKMCGTKCYNYYYGSNARMIGGQKK